MRWLGPVVALAGLLTSPFAAALDGPRVVAPLQQCAVADQLSESVRSGGNRTVADWLAGQAALCRGLLQDDAWSLEEALSLLDAVVAAQPGDAFALIDRADAWSARYPAARETEDAIDAALAGVTQLTLGAAAAPERSRLMENRRLVRARRVALEGEAGRDTGDPAADLWRDALGAEAGPAAARRVAAALAARVAAQRDDVDAALVLAEVLRGRAPRSALAARYREVERAACGGSGPHKPGGQAVCALSRLRLQQLGIDGRSDGSIDHPALEEDDMVPTTGSHRLNLILAVTLLVAIGARGALAVSCPLGGASIDICVTNDTAYASGPLTVSGQVVGAEITCTGPPPIGGTYGSAITNVLPGQTVCAPAPAPNGLVSGMYNHRIQVAGTTQDQRRQRPVLAAAPGQPITRIDWTIASHVITVNVAGDSGTGTCPVNAVSAPPTCDIRTALTQAKNITDTQPVLISLAVSPGVMSGVNLQVERRRTTIDGTDLSGNPWIVGDPNAAAAGSVDSIPRVLEFSVNRGLRIMADEVTLRGLELRHQQGSGSVSNANLVYQTANRSGTRLEAVRLDGDNQINCQDPGVDCSSFLFSLVRVESQGSAPTAPSMTWHNVDARAGAYFGLEMLQHTEVTVDKSWLRHSYQGNVRADAATLAMTRTTVERAGLRASDGASMVTGAPGVRLTNSAPLAALTSYAGLENVVRNNRAAGLTASGLTDVELERDVYCGNGGSGLTSAVGPSSFEPGINGLGGVGAMYNSLHGARVLPGGFGAVSFDDDSVFARNGLCALFNESMVDDVSAENNQWTDPVVDSCTGQPGAGTVDHSPVQNPDSEPIGIAGTFPSNVILGGQTVQIAGTGFNAIRGNPAAGGGICSNGPSGATESCCRKTTRANRCASVNTPVDGDGNCVEFRTGTGLWFSSAVRAVTPAMLEVEVPNPVFACLGNSNEIVRVHKKVGLIESQNVAPYCNNAAAL